MHQQILEVQFNRWRCVKNNKDCYIDGPVQQNESVTTSANLTYIETLESNQNIQEMAHNIFLFNDYIKEPPSTIL